MEWEDCTEEEKSRALKTVADDRVQERMEQNRVKIIHEKKKEKAMTKMKIAEPFKCFCCNRDSALGQRIDIDGDGKAELLCRACAAEWAEGQINDRYKMTGDIKKLNKARKQLKDDDINLAKPKFEQEDRI